ncbi:hypothetical protein EGW08_012591 [Elysia chlorotica]|uniref:G-protein coupled receptors family 1 profile domain-containing protein n=1 Tax=Elysia chlorotica TaxID=188477 RepID=A0A433TDT4_ELYCH|nr:hypothetical protein EGW08_012591 [Elysia chlorotica]
MTSNDTMSGSGTTSPGHESQNSSAGETSTDLVVVTVMLASMAVVGTVGNALAIYVFARLKQKLTSTIFILTLAGTDFVTCLITIPFTIIMEHLDYYVENDVLCKAYFFLITTTVPFSCVVIVAIAVDRYMCICHPFHHWMTICRARIIVFVMGVCIFLIGGIVAAHHRTTKEYSEDQIRKLIMSTISPGMGTEGGVASESNFTTNHDAAGAILTASLGTATVHSKCTVDTGFIHEEFFKYFHKGYISIFILSCIIVLVLYSLIYRSVIAQRKKKLRIKSAQCCLLWNATSVEAPPEMMEMTQDIELSHVNGGEDRFATRQLSGAGATAEELEAAITDGGNTSAPAHNNGSSGPPVVRKSSLSNARIERMRVANIKTAGTLFVVTIVFIIAFLPAWLMVTNVLQMNVIVFYMYFIYNVVNPFIYAFLNQNFKTELKRIFHCRAQ